MPLGGDRRRRVGQANDVTKTQEFEVDRRPAPDLTATPRGGRAGYAGEDATWSRDRLSRHHIISAHNFAEAARTVENEDPDEVPLDDKWRYRAYVTAAVLSSAGFLEASINELYLELQKVTKSGDSQLRHELALLVNAWPQIVSSPVLQKYQIALSVTDADQYNEDASPYADAECLVRLRDALLSYNAEWDDTRGRHQVLEARLKDAFPPSPLVSAQRPWFPDRCLGAGCAKWAVKTAQLFANDFYRRMALPGRPLVGGAEKPAALKAT
jgi:hypothetical protein